MAKIGPDHDALNKHGFTKDSYDETTETIVIPSDIKQQMLAAFPKDYKTRWKYYTDVFLCLAGYLVIALFLIYHQRQLSAQYYQDNNIWHRIKYLCLSPLLGWSALGIVLTGHDANHGTAAPRGTLVGRMVNTVTAFLTMDCLIVSSWVWRREHTHHHKNVNVVGVDDMYIQGDNIVTEQLNALSLLPRYWWFDLCEVCTNWKLDANGIVLWRKLRLLCGAYIRFYYTFYLLHNGDAWLLGANALFTFVWTNYIGYLSHSIPVRSKGQTDDYFIFAMRETWDIFPRSLSMNFFHCGIAAHCSHHIFPYMPRSLYATSAKVLTRFCKDEYREISTLQDEWWLLWNRRTKK